VIRSIGRLIIASLLGALVACAAPPPPKGSIARSDHFNGTRFFNPDGEQGTGGHQTQSVMKLIDDLVRPPHHSWPEHVPITPSRPPSRIEGADMLVTWIGHSTVLVQTQGLNILTDPVWAERASPVSFLGVKRVREPGVRLADLPKLDLILLSHDHYDHLDTGTLGTLWRRDHPLIVTGLGNDLLLKRYHIHAVARDWGQAVTVRPGVDVILDRAHHWSEHGIGDHDRTLWTGFTITLPGGNLYFAGDTGPGDMRWAIEAARAGPVRFAILPIGAYHFEGRISGNHIGPDQAVTAFGQLHASYALGVHWGTFELTAEAIDDPPNGLAVALRKAGIGSDRFRVLEAGQSWRIPPN
jgi:L-ascorbate metabolism protein UlaG (beta-lactamase superfamily)